MPRKDRTPEIRKYESIRRNYGLTREEYDTLLQQQGGVCLICMKPKSLVVDHDHNTGKVRGLLCQRCNIFAGMIETAEADEFMRLLEHIGRK